MTNRAHIPIPEGFDDENSGFELPPYLQRFVKGELAQALDTDVWELDDRAHAYETEITNVEIQGDNIIITYNVLFDAYYGCKDQNYAGQDERILTGTRIGAYWVFEQYVPRQRRSTYDEF